MHEEATSRPWRTHGWTWGTVFRTMIWLHLNVFFAMLLNGIGLNVCVCVKGRNKTMWGLNGNAENLEDRKQTPTVLKLCVRSNYKDLDLTKWLLELLHRKIIYFCRFAIYEQCCRITCILEFKPVFSLALFQMIVMWKTITIYCIRLLKSLQPTSWACSYHHLSWKSISFRLYYMILAKDAFTPQFLAQLCCLKLLLHSHGASRNRPTCIHSLTQGLPTSFYLRSL